MAAKVFHIEMALAVIFVSSALEMVATEFAHKSYRHALVFDHKSRQNMGPVKANNLRNCMMDAGDIAAQTLVDEYNSKNSIVTREQELGILDLSRQLNQPGLSNIESDIVSACTMIKANLGGQGKQYPPEDVDDEIDKSEDDSETHSLSELMRSETPEKSVISISSRIVSMGKGLLQALFTLTGSVGGAITDSIKKTVAKAIKDRRISVCSKMSLETLVKEKEKIDQMVKKDKGCNISQSLGFSLSNLHVAVSLLKCYIQASGDKRSGEMLSFKEEIIFTLKQIDAIQQLNIPSQYANNQKEIFEKFLELQDRLEALNYNSLVVRLSDDDVSLQTYNMALSSLMRNIFSLLQVSYDTDLKDNRKLDEVYCETGDMMISEFRRLGTTSVDRLTQTARTVVNSFDVFATKSISILARLNTYKEMYDLISLTAKGLQDGLNAAC